MVLISNHDAEYLEIRANILLPRIWTGQSTFQRWSEGDRGRTVKVQTPAHNTELQGGCAMSSPRLFHGPAERCDSPKEGNRLLKSDQGNKPQRSWGPSEPFLPSRYHCPSSPHNAQQTASPMQGVIITKRNKELGQRYWGRKERSTKARGDEEYTSQGDWKC